MVHFSGRFKISHAAYIKTAEKCSAPIRKMSWLWKKEFAAHICLLCLMTHGFYIQLLL